MLTHAQEQCTKVMGSGELFRNVSIVSRLYNEQINAADKYRNRKQEEEEKGERK